MNGNANANFSVPNKPSYRHYDGCMEAIVTNPNINVIIYLFQASSVPMVVEGKAMDLVPQLSL